MSLISSVSFGSSSRPPSSQGPLADSIARIEELIAKKRKEIPHPRLEGLTCSITYEILEDPVITNCGHIFEKKMLETWQNTQNTNKPCPNCRIKITGVFPIPALKEAIQTLQIEGPILTLGLFTKDNERRAKAFIAAADALILARDYEGALQAYSSAFQFSKSLADYRQIPWIYEQLGETKKAELARLYLGLYQLQENELGEALATFEGLTSEELDPILEQLRLHLDHNASALDQAVLRAQQKNTSEGAISLYKLILSYDPDRFDVYRLLVSLVQNPEERTFFLSQAADRAKVLGQAELDKAVLSAQQKNTSEGAISLYKLVLLCDPDRFNVYRLLLSLVQNPKERTSLLLQAADRAKALGQAEIEAEFRSQIPEVSMTTITVAGWADPSTLNLPPYPRELIDFLEGDCTIWPGKKRSKTHIVVPCFPKVQLEEGGEEVPLTLATLGAFDKKAGGTGYRCIWDDILQDVPAEDEFYWAVMTRDVLPESRNKTYAQQRLLMPAGYEVPKALNAARAILWNHRSAKERLFSDNPPTHTRCQEEIDGVQLSVGGFARRGLYVDYYYDSDDEELGVAGWRKF